MSISISCETQLRLAFDEFFDNVKFKGIDISPELKSMIETVEEDLVLSSEAWTDNSELNDNLQDEYERGYDVGFTDGETGSYDQAFEDGYDQAKEKYNTEV